MHRLRRPADLQPGVWALSGLSLIHILNGKPMACTISGVIRGMLADGTPVFKGMKSGDVDPRGEIACSTPPPMAMALSEAV